MALYVQETGTINAHTLIFLHGGGGGGWMWQPQVEQLSDFHCLVPDLPEHGKSVNEKPFTIQNSAERIAELIQTRAHDRKASVIGLSEGAQIVVALLAISPELVDHAVISSALVHPIFGASLMTPKLIALSYRWSVTPFKNSEWWIRINMKYAAGVPEKYYSQFSQTFKELTETGFTNCMVENQRFRLPQGLERVKTPTLVLVGKNEHSVMRRSARDLASAILGAQAYEVVHNRKMSLAEEHNWNLTAPELFTQTTRAWINDQPLPAELKPLRS
ncbi:MAG: alpha/beta hydrolase [Anaerolineales bacterium]|nr:alpha/beta hydrolase [Anaerolineales bacterium]